MTGTKSPRRPLRSVASSRVSRLALTILALVCVGFAPHQTLAQTDAGSGFASTLASFGTETDEASAQRARALAEGQRLREAARLRARERAKLQQEGKPTRDLAAEAEEARVDALHRTKPKHERRALEKEKRRQSRRRILEEAAAEARKVEHQEARTGRRLQEETSKPSCDNSKLDAGFDTDVDCGGECRDVTVLDRGLWFPRRCGFAQQCEIGADCLSGSCVSGRCAARAPFAAVPETELIRNMHYAYFHLAEQKNEDTLDAQDVDEFFKLVFNPDQVDLTETQTALFDQGLMQFKDSQGLQDSGSSVALQYGFLARGRSLQFAKEMIQSANAAARRREL